VDKDFPVISIPFEERHKCWFCGEPYLSFIAFPMDTADIRSFYHEPCKVPACKECQLLTEKERLRSVFAYKKTVKKKLTKKYANELQIGNRWTEQELKDSELDGAAFLGFKKSAWLMHTIAKERVNYAGWRVEVNGVIIDEDVNQTAFNFDGMDFISIEAAVDYYAEAYYLNHQLLSDAVKLLPREQFSFAIRLCRLYPVFHSSEYSGILAEIKLRISESN